MVEVKDKISAEVLPVMEDLYDQEKDFIRDMLLTSYV
jgi:hypothetical protein